MIKKITFLLIFTAFSVVCTGQVGINTNNPQGTLDINSVNNTGLVLPRVTSLSEVTDGNDGFPVNGTTVYDLSINKTCFYNNRRWLCVGFDENGNPALEDETPPPSRQRQLLQANEVGQGDEYGTSVAISDDGNTIAIGAIQEDSGSGTDPSDNSIPNSGAVYIYERDGNNWVQQAYVKPQIIGNRDFFGSTVQLSSDGNMLIVGAEEEDSNGSDLNDNSSINSGAVYVFTRQNNDWTQQQVLKQSTVISTSKFGRSMQLSNDNLTLIIGAEGEDTDQNGNIPAVSYNSGAAYVFTYDGTNWTETAVLKADTVGREDNFGYSVSVNADGTVVTVGATSEGSDGSGPSNNDLRGSGAAYVFRLTNGNWSQEAYLKANFPDEFDFFGRQVVLNTTGNKLYVSAPFEDSDSTTSNNGNARDSGAVYVFENNNSIWSQTSIVKPNLLTNVRSFGNSISISNDSQRLLIGADRSSNTAPSTSVSGSAYTFLSLETGLEEFSQLNRTNPRASDFFGFMVALSGNGRTAVVGTPQYEDPANLSNFDNGGVFIYE